jgi:arabinan endo-1,5-alpha-L-arabinosidase
MNKSLSFFLAISFLLLLASCNSFNKKSETSKSQITDEQLNPNIPDDYSKLADYSNRDKWGLYNVHDPSGIKVDDYYYVYSTDVMLGYHKQPQVGIQVRRSKDLVHFEFLGWAFNGIPKEAFDYVKKINDGREPDNIWAPFIMKHKNTFRLYYSVSCMGSDASYIGLAESNSPEGPWVQKGAVVTSARHGGHNAIDPAVVVDNKTNEHWMAYGSCFGGIFMLKLDASTGLAQQPGDLGALIASRDNVSADGCGKGENGIDGTCNIEGVDIVYNPQFSKYYLFVSYDWLGHKYNVRVGKADAPNGPYKDFDNKDFTEQINHKPVLTHAYKFENHAGWAGLGHCGILTDGDKFYMLHQGRLQPQNAMMDLHIREITWTTDGWPVVSPERFVQLPQSEITSDKIAGTWEEIILNVEEPVNQSSKLTFLPNGTIHGLKNSTWKLVGNQLIINKENEPALTLYLLNTWDWENSKSTIVYTGLNNKGLGVWGKKR